MTLIEDYIDSLTPEEREEHKGLIKECRKREKKLDKIHLDNKRTFNLLEREIKNFFNNLHEVYNSSRESKTILSNYLERVRGVKEYDKLKKEGYTRH